ncbi:MAG: DNA polymerase/3'-5' exonuclease PolX [Planctomycetes bacterium]|nr:DNA polymerase/3'-5' exonuclease PolX [Planctomycetota bacterium]
MPIHNSDIEEILDTVANLLEIKGENPFRVRAYRNAARTIQGLSQSVAEMVHTGQDLSELPGVGKDLGDYPRSSVETGTLLLLKELQGELPAGLTDLMKVSGLGPKRVAILYKELGITTLTDLAQAAEQGRIQALGGFGKKTEQRILEDTAKLQQTQAKRISLVVAEQVAGPLVEYLQQTPGAQDVIVAGSYRRQKETVADLDILATCGKGSKVMDRFVGYEDVRQVVSQGQTRSTVILRTGVQVDLRVVPQASYGAALMYFTGSKEHNIAVRKIGLAKKLKINEYGAFRGDKRVAGRTEEEMYAKIGLPYIEPELREDRGEIEAARKGKLPQLLEVRDIRGDLHVHTKRTDGHDTIEELVEAARRHGYDYLAITDHSKHVTVAHGLKPEQVHEQVREIDKINKKLKGFTVLKSTEVDILEDGSLDLPDEVLQELDLTVCSVHYKFNLSLKEQTDRICTAMENPYFTILAHATGRLIGQREPYQVDMEKVMKAAQRTGCILEVNAHPDRLDLNDVHCKMAKDMGVKVALSTDTHRLGNLDYMRFGVGQARRGWLEADDVINTRSVTELKKFLRKSRKAVAQLVS